MIVKGIPKRIKRWRTKNREEHLARQRAYMRKYRKRKAAKSVAPSQELLASKLVRKRPQEGRAA